MTNLLWFPIERSRRATATATDCPACAVIDAVDQLDASTVSVLRLEAASDLPAGTFRARAFGTRLSSAGLSEAMRTVSSIDLDAAPSAEIQRIWRSLEQLLIGLTACVTCLSEPALSADERYMMRVRLQVTCRSALTDLHRLRVLLVGIYGATRESAT